MRVKAALSAQKRDGRGKGVARKLRAAGRVPAVVYGKDQEPIALSLDAREAVHLFHAISVDNTIINVRIEGESEEMETLVREVQTHPFKADLLHVDFYRIQRGVSIEVDIPVRLEGTPVGVRDGGGVLEITLHDLRVKCIPSEIPETIEIDVKHLDVGDSLHVSEISPPQNVEFVTDGIHTICSVALPKVIVEPELELEELDEAEIEEGAAPEAAEEAPEGEEEAGDE
jgi:large subunit ribosomal protein L25